jgi:fumarate reductase flavoprotein subunit
MRAAASMSRALHKRGLELGVQFYLETPVHQLVKKDGTICGFLAKDKNGDEYECSCKAVIIATGGFGTNPEMVKDLTGYELMKNISTHNIPGIVGEGIKMAWEAGAMRGRTMMESGAIPMTPGALTGAYSSGHVYWQPRTIMVNKQGYRVCDESILQNSSVGGSIVSYQKDKVCLKILTDEIAKYYIKNGLDWPSEVFNCDPENFFEEMEDCISKYPGQIFIEESPEALAESMGVDVSNFLKTVEEYNDACDQNFDDYFCKPRQHLQKLKGKKWYAVYVKMAAYGSLGGIRTNYKYEVLDNEFGIIPGLYAAGTDCCEIFNGIYMYYMPGNTMGFALNSGRFAGENAANKILGVED